MSVTLWVDTGAEEAVELGPTLPCYAAFAHMARVAGEAWESEYGALAGVLTQCELQDDADPDWLADVRREAGEFLERFGDALTEDERDILTELAAPPVAKAVVLKGFDEDAHPRDDAGRFISKEDIDAAKADPAKAAELRGRVKPGDEGKLDAALAAAGEPAPTKEEPAATPVDEAAALFDRLTPEELLDLSKRLAERLAALRPQPEEHHAPETGQLEGGDLPEHQDRGGGGQAAEAGGGDRAEHGAGAEGRPEEEVKPAVAKPARPKPQPKPPAGDPTEHAAALAKARDAALSAVSRGKIGKAAEYDPAPLRAAYDAAAKQPKPVLLRILLAITGTAGDPQMAAYYGKMSAAKLAAALFDHTIGRVEARQRADM